METTLVNDDATGQGREVSTANYSQPSLSGGQPQIVNHGLVTVSNGQATTTSLIVAQAFGKRHSTVLRAIKNLECSDGFTERNFVLSEYVDQSGRRLPMFKITRDGFSFLVMGFSGRNAARWKERFIEAFNTLAREIQRVHALHVQPDWQAARLEGKTVRRSETDVIKAFVEYAMGQGSKNAARYYMVISKEINRALFFVQSAVGAGFRDTLTVDQLKDVATAEKIVERALLEAMSGKMFYKEGFRLAVERLRQFAVFVGKSVPGHSTPLLEAA